jgi:hypothetical protein
VLGQGLHAEISTRGGASHARHIRESALHASTAGACALGSGDMWPPLRWSTNWLYRPQVAPSATRFLPGLVCGRTWGVTRAAWIQLVVAVVALSSCAASCANCCFKSDRRARSCAGVSGSGIRLVGLHAVTCSDTAAGTAVALDSCSGVGKKLCAISTSNRLDGIPRISVHDSYASMNAFLTKGSSSLMHLIVRHPPASRTESRMRSDNFGGGVLLQPRSI